MTLRISNSWCREYVEADEAWDAGAAFLAAGDGAGWAFLEGCTKPAWRQRLTPETALQHPFLKGAGVE